MAKGKSDYRYIIIDIDCAAMNGCYFDGQTGPGAVSIVEKVPQFRGTVVGVADCSATTGAAISGGQAMLRKEDGEGLGGNDAAARRTQQGRAVQPRA